MPLFYIRYVWLKKVWSSVKKLMAEWQTALFKDPVRTAQ